MSYEYQDYPFGIGKDGRVARTDEDDHIRDLIEQVLFTSQGERVNLPEFGCGLKDIIFDPNDEVLATITEVAITAALHKWLEDIIHVDEVRVTAEDEKLIIKIEFTKLKSQEKTIVQFERG